MSGDVTLLLPGVSGGSTLALRVNTTGAAVTVGSTTVAAGPFVELTAGSLTLTIAGQTLTGTFTLQRAGGTTTLTVAGGTLAIGNLSLKDVAGSLTVSAAGVAGHLVATLDANTTGLTLSGTIEVAVNTTSVAVGDLPAGPFLRVAVAGGSLTVGPLTLKADLAFENGTRTVGTTTQSVVLVGISNGSLAFPAGSPLVRVTGATGALVLLSGAIAGSLSGEVVVAVPGVSVSGALALEVNTGSAAVDETIRVGGADQHLVLTGVSGGYLRVGGKGLAIDVLGQRLTGDVTVTRSSTATTITVSGASLSIGGGALTISGASLDLTVAADGVVGTMTGLVTVNVPGVTLTGTVSAEVDTRAGSAKVRVGGTSVVLEVQGLKLTGAIWVQRDSTGTTVTVTGAALDLGGFVSASDINGGLVIAADGIAGALDVGTLHFTLPSTLTLADLSGRIEVNTRPVATTVPVGSGSAALPAGSFVRVAVTVPSGGLAIGSLGTLSGSFVFQRSAVAGSAAVTVLAVTGGAVHVAGPPTADVSDVTGALVLAGTGFAGFLNGTLTTSGIPGFDASAKVMVRANTTGDAVRQTIEVGGQSLDVVFGDGTPTFSLTALGASLTIAGLVTIEGDFTTSGTTFAGRNLRVFIGTGPAFLADGSRNPGARGLLLTGATVAFVKVASAYALDVRGTLELVGFAGVTLGGTVRVRVNQTTALVAPTTISFGDGGEDVVLAFSDTETATSSSAPYVSVTGTGLTVGALGQTLTANLEELTKLTDGFSLRFSGLSLSLGDAADLTGGAGTWTFGSTGVSGTLTGSIALHVPGVSLSTSSVSLALNTTPATVGGVPAGPYFRVSATGLDLVVAGQQVHAGTLTVERSTVGGTPVTRLEITGGGLVLTAGGTDFVTLDQVAGTLVLSAAGVSGRLSARVTLGGGLGSVLTVGTVRVALNTGAATVGDLPAGPYVRVEALGAALTLGGQTLTGDLAFERSTTQAGATVVRVVASHVGLTLTAGTTPVATLTDGSGLILLTSTGMALQLGGTIAVTVPGVTVTGALVVQANSTGAAVNEVLSLDGADVLLAMPSNGTSSYLRFVGTGMVLDVAGQRLAGDLTIERNGLVTTVGLTGASLSLGGGLLTVTGASASLTVEPTGLHGSFSGAVAFAAPGISLGANLTVDLDTRPATRHVTVSGPDVSVTVAGQSLRAAVSFESTTTAAGQRVVRAAIANVGPNPLLTLGTPGSQVSVTTASGQLLLTGTGVALGLTATVAVTLPGITLTPGTVRVEVNTLTAPVAETFTVAGSPVTLSLPAGPYLRVSLTGASLALTTVPGTPTLSGSFAFEQRGQRTIIAATDVEVAVSIGTTAARLTQGQGVFVLVGASGIAGYLSGKASVAAGGVQAGGDILLRVDTALNTAIDETVEVGGQTLNVKFPSSATAVYAVSLTGARLTIGDFVTIEGDVAFTNDTFAGDGLTLFVGRGPARLDTGELNPLATGVLMTNARIGLVRVGAGYALVASGTVSLVGVTGVTLTGTVTARVNTTGAALTRTLTIDGSAGPGIELAFTGPEVVKEFQAVGATLTVAGQSLTGTFAFSQVAGGDVTVAATGVAANLGGGAVTLSSGTAALLVSANGIAGRITGTLNVSVPGLTLGSGFTVVLNSSAAPVSRTFDVAGTTVALDVPAGPFVRVEATHMTIGLLGQSLTADLVIQRATGADGTAVTTVGLANVDLVLGSGGTGVRLTGGSGLLVAGTGGIAGRLSGTVAVTLPAGTSLTGDLTVAVNTGFGAVSTSLTVGSTTLTLALPAGPYLRFEGTGLVLTVLGQTLSGDVAFEKATDLGADGAIGGTGLNADTSVVRLAMTHVAIDLGGVLKVREGTALLLLTPAGLAGTVSGTVTLAVPQVSLTGTLAVQVNTTGAAVSTSFLVAGAAGPVSLALPKGPYLRLAGTGVVLTVLGQSLAADVVLTRTVDAAGASTVTVEVRNLDLRLGGTAASPVVSVSQATGGVGTLVLGPTGVVGSIAVDVAVALPNVTLTGGFAVQVNTTSVAALGVPAGPFVRVSGTGVHLNVLDQVLTGSFTVEQVTTTAGAKVVRVGISGASLVLLLGQGQRHRRLRPRGPLAGRRRGLARGLAVRVAHGRRGLGRGHPRRQHHRGGRQQQPRRRGYDGRARPARGSLPQGHRHRRHAHGRGAGAARRHLGREGHLARRRQAARHRRRQHAAAYRRRQRLGCVR